MSSLAKLPPYQTADSADEHYAKGLALEDTDPDGARAAYEACLAADPQHMEARINLGRLLHMAGRLADAERVYRSAKKPESVLLFNLAVLLEDLEREPDAIVAYREALALDPQLADAHFNLARLYERARNPKVVPASSARLPAHDRSARYLTWPSRRSPSIAQSATFPKPRALGPNTGGALAPPAFRRAEARRAPIALRPAARMGRRIQIVGRDPRPLRRSRGQASRRRSRGPSPGLRRFRGHDSQRRVWRRHGAAVGPRILDSRGRASHRRMRSTAAISNSPWTENACRAVGFWCACAAIATAAREPIGC